VGDGRFVGGKLTFLVSAAYGMTAADRTAWQAALQRSSDFMYVATGGQVQFGDIYLVDDSFGRLSADVLIFNTTGTAEATQGEFGTPGASVHYYDNDRGSPSIFDHELAHHVWNLGDEYAGPMQPVTIDRSAPAPDRRTIPVVETLVAGALVGGHANVRHSALQSDRRRIISNTDHQIVVDADYPDLPTNSSDDIAYFQESNKACGSPAATGVNFCIMESPATGVIAFCDPTTHNAVDPTDQQVRNGTSCWETITTEPGFEGLAVPAGSPASPPDPITVIDVLKEARFVLAIDRSASMSGDKLTYAKEGARYWVDSCALADDYLSVIAYNADNTITLPLTQIGSVPDRSAITDAIEALSAQGQTNVRDALREGVTQITSRPGRVVTQAVVVLTDGKHNRPAGSRLIEAAPDLVDSHVMAATIAIGEGSDVDAAELDELAYQTGGHFALLGLSNPVDIETTLIETDMYLRGGLIDTQSFDFIPAPVDRAAKATIARLYRRRRPPRLEEVLDAFGLRLSGLSGRRPFGDQTARFRIAKVLVERGCERISCAINHALGAAFDVFLVNPAGAGVEVDDVIVKRATGPAHTLLTVANPVAGVWRVIVFAREVPTASSVHLSVGAENRRLVVTGGCTRSVYRSNERPRLYARAAWDLDLTGLQVDAQILAESGTTTNIQLTDGNLFTDLAGRYGCDVPALRVGHYRGVIRISAPRRPLRAGMLHIANHSTASQLSARTSASSFHRCIPIRFHVAKGR
jgi:uncharacterized protein YegL